MILKLLCFWTVRVVAAVAVGMAATSAGRAQAIPPPVWTVPEVGALPDDDHGRLVRRGRDLITATYAHIGPAVADEAKRYAGNNLACSNCHLNAGTKKFGIPLDKMALWNPHEATGRPLFAEGSHSVLHPVSVALAFLAPDSVDALLLACLPLATAGLDPTASAEKSERSPASLRAASARSDFSSACRISSARATTAPGSPASRATWMP